MEEHELTPNEIEGRLEDIYDKMADMGNTLHNHMTDYKNQFTVFEALTGGSFDLMNERIGSIGWVVKAVILPLLCLVCGGLIALASIAVARGIP